MPRRDGGSRGSNFKLRHYRQCTKLRSLHLADNLMHRHRNCCHRDCVSYRIPPQRLSNEPDGTTGVAPVIMPDPWAAGAGFGNGEAGAELDAVEFAGAEFAGAICATSVRGFAAAGCGLVTAWI